MHKSVIEAAGIKRVEKFGFDEARARRVLRAQAQPEAVPDESVHEACVTFFDHSNYMPNDVYRMCAALSAALMHMAGVQERDHLAEQCAIPAEVRNQPIEPMCRMDMLRVTALGMAVRYYTETIIKDGVMYQQKKMEGANLQPASHEGVLRCAISFERYLRGDYAEMADLIVDGDFNAWLKEQTERAIKMAAQEMEQ